VDARTPPHPGAGQAHAGAGPDRADPLATRGRTGPIGRPGLAVPGRAPSHRAMGHELGRIDALASPVAFREVR
jgi:hypothetical protein